MCACLTACPAVSPQLAGCGRRCEAKGALCPRARRVVDTFGRMPKPVAVVALVALALAAPVLAGCGSSKEKGGSTSGSAGQQTLGRSALDAKADAICATYRSKFLDIKLPTDLTDVASIGTYAEAAHGLFRNRHVELAALRPDDATKPQWDAFITADQATTDLLGQLEAAAKTKVVARIAQVTGQSQVVLQKAAAAADAVGATGCGSAAG